MDTICPEIRVDKTQADERAWQVWADQVVGEVAEVVRQQLHGVRPDEGEDLRVIEHRVQAVLRPVGKALLEACGSRAAEDLPRPLCCGRPMHRAHRRPRAMQGAVGDWDLTRTEYVCDHCGRRHVPADEFWGIGSGQCSPLMAELASRAGAEIPSFDRAAALLGQTLGTSVCGDTLGRTSEAVGLVAELEQREAMALARRLLTEPTGDLAPAAELPAHLVAVRRALFPDGETADRPGTAAADDVRGGEAGTPDPGASPCPPKAADTAPFTLLLGIDATKAQANKVWRDVKVAVVAPLGPEQTTPKREAQYPRLLLGPRSYCAAIEEVDDFFYRIVVLLACAGWRRSQPLRLVLTGDGGPWIWTCAQRLRALGIEVVEILDIYHAREHLWEVAHAVLGTGVDGYQWGDEMARKLKEKGPAPVLQALQALNPRGQDQQDLVRKAIDYFTTNTTRMNYPDYAALGLPLGSGIIESSCRLVSGMRVKQPGMRWSLSGVQAVLSLRALHLSQTTAWDDFWRRKPLLRRPSIATLTQTEVCYA